MIKIIRWYRPKGIPGYHVELGNVIPRNQRTQTRVSKEKEAIMAAEKKTVVKDTASALEADKKMHHNKVDSALGITEGTSLEEMLTELVKAEGAEEGDNIHVALIDLDHFMRVNTDFGHDEGDRVLIETGEHIRKYLGGEGTFFRVAGDEFGIIFKGSMEKEDVFLLMEKMRSEYNVVLKDGSAQTICVGIATAFENSNRPQEIMRMAESAMFRVKYAGRNKVGLAKEEKMVPKTAHFTSDQLKRLNLLSKREGVGEAILLREAMDMLLKKYDV